MSGAGRANPRKPSPAAPAAAVPDEHMGRVDGPQIDLGAGHRRVTGTDLFMFHALVSQNEQTIEDLSELRPNDDQALARYARQTRPPFVTEGLLDRMNDRLTGWLARRTHAVRQWLFRSRNGPSAVNVQGKLRDAPAAGRTTPPPGRTPMPKRAA